MRTGKGFVHRLVIGAPIFIWITAGVLGIPSASLAAFSTLHKFITSGSDGTFPHGAVTISGSTLYGTTSEGGDQNDGTVFNRNNSSAFRNGAANQSVLTESCPGTSRDFARCNAVK